MKPPTAGEVMPSFLQDALQLSEAQRKQVADLQKEVDGKLARILDADQAKKWADLRERGPFGFPLPGGFGPPAGFGPPGGGLSAKADLDPLTGLSDARKPLRSKLFAVPALRVKYLGYVGRIAEEWLDWRKLGRVVARHRGLIEKEVEIETRRLDSYGDFQRATADIAEASPPRGRPLMSLRTFADQRRQYLLHHAEVKKAMKGE
jgi:hypothetical protein